jgi:hypothetical protein
MADRAKCLNRYGDVIPATIKLGAQLRDASTTEGLHFYGMNELTGLRGNMRKLKLLLCQPR